MPPHRAADTKAGTAARICFVVSGIMLLIVAILAAIGIGIPQWVRMEPRVQPAEGERAINVGMYDMVFEFRRPFANCKTDVMVGDLGCHVDPWEISYGAVPVSDTPNIPVNRCLAWCRGTDLQVLGTVSSSEWLQVVAQAGQSGVAASNGMPLPSFCHNYEPPRALIISALVIAFVAACCAFAATKTMVAGMFACFLSLASFILMLIGFIMAAIQASAPCTGVNLVWESTWGASFILVIIAVILVFCSTCTLLMGLLSAYLGRRRAGEARGPDAIVIDHTVRRDGAAHVEAYPVTAPQMHVVHHV